MIVPVVTLAVEAIREFREIVDYGRSLEESGIPVPDFVARLPYSFHFYGFCLGFSEASKASSFSGFFSDLRSWPH